MAILPLVSLVNITKSKGLFTKRDLILDGVSATFSRERSAILGGRETGTSTLLNLIAGIYRASSGRILRNGAVSVPPSMIIQIAPYKTGRKLVQFLARLYEADPHETVDFVMDFAELSSNSIDRRIGYMDIEGRLKLSFALAYATPADLYLFEGDIYSGGKKFRQKCEDAYSRRCKSAGSIVATRNVNRAAALAEKGCVLHNGRLYAFDEIGAAIDFYHRLALESDEHGSATLQSLLRAGHSTVAEDFLREEGSAESFVALAQIALKHGRYEEALEAAEAAVLGGGDTDRMSAIKASAWDGLGDSEKVVECLEPLAECEGASTEILTLLARNLEKMGDLRRAGQIWKRLAIKTNSFGAFKRAQVNLVKVEDWAELLALTNEAASSHPQDVMLWELRFRAYVGQGRWDDVQVVIEHISQIDSLKSLTLIYGVAKSDAWQEAPNLVRALPVQELQKLRGERVSGLLATVLRRHAALMRKSDQHDLAEKVEKAISYMAAETVTEI